MAKNEKVEIEEAKNRLKQLIRLRKNKCGQIKYDSCICGTKDLETVLQELSNLQEKNQTLVQYIGSQGMIGDYIKFRNKKKKDRNIIK